MTALTLERIEELRERLRFILDKNKAAALLGRGDMADLLSLLDKEAAQLKDAKAGAVTVGLNRDSGEETNLGPVVGANPRPGSPSPGPEDERATIRRAFSHLDFLVEMREKAHGDAETYRNSLLYIRSRLAGVRVTREQVKKFAMAMNKRQDPVDYACDELRSLGVRVVGDK